MKHKKSYVFICSMVVTTLICTSAAWGQVAIDGNSYASKASKKIAAPTTVKVIKKSSTSLKVSWNKVDGAKGYVVYKYDSKSKKFKKAKTLKKSQLSWKNKKLKKNKIYKYKVRAFTKKGGKIKYGSYSYVVSAKTYTKKAKKVNVKSVKVDYANHYLGLKGAAKVNAWVDVPNGKQAISKKLVWKSSDKTIVKVTKTGWIQGKGKVGTAKVYIRAHNGATKTLKVTVKDYANPTDFTKLDKVTLLDGSAEAILTTYKAHMCIVAAFLEKYKTKTTFVYEDSAIQFEGQGINYAPIETELENLLKNAGMSIYLANGSLTFILPNGNVVSYLSYNGKDYPEYGSVKIAPCWFFILPASH